MLHNPKWDVQTKPDALSLAGLVAWLETKPADEKYDFTDCRGKCLYGQYMASHGFGWEEASSFRANVYMHVAYQYPWTFGAALERARKAVT